MSDFDGRLDAYFNNLEYLYFRDEDDEVNEDDGDDGEIYEGDDDNEDYE